MHKLKQKIRDEIKDIEHDGRLGMGELQTLHLLTDTLKNIYKIDMLADGESGYSGDHWVRGHYSRDGRGGSYEGYSERRDSRGRYARDGRGGSYDGSYGGPEEARRHIEAALASADEADRGMIEQLLNKMR